MYTDQFFDWLHGYNNGVVNAASELDRAVAARNDDLRQIFSWCAVWISIICCAISILAIKKEMKEKGLAYVSLITSAITIMVFVISFFGHGILPTRGIL
jgi:hypothetical protein